VHELQDQLTGALQTDLLSLPPSSFLPSSFLVAAAAAAFVAGPGNEAVERGRAEKEQLDVIVVKLRFVPRKEGREGGREGGVGGWVGEKDKWWKVRRYGCQFDGLGELVTMK